MSQVYATPGVYIEEKSAFPTSAVAVATAVPVFIGYTEKAVRNNKSIVDKPTRLTSLSEYHEFFGFGPKITFTIGDGVAPEPFNLKVDKATQFYLYNALRLFFSNGGSTCYIVSIGLYDAAKGVESDVLNPKDDNKGIQALMTEPEPTMVVIPDAVLLDEADCNAVQTDMLKHCGFAMPNRRVALLDVFNGHLPRTRDENDVVTKFRDGIGNNFLQWGAAYYPWVESTVVSAAEVSLSNISNLDKLKTILSAELKRLETDKKKAAALNAELGNLDKVTPAATAVASAVAMEKAASAAAAATTSTTAAAAVNAATKAKAATAAAKTAAATAKTNAETNAAAAEKTAAEAKTAAEQAGAAPDKAVSSNRAAVDSKAAAAEKEAATSRSAAADSADTAADDALAKAKAANTAFEKVDTDEKAAASADSATKDAALATAKTSAEAAVKAADESRKSATAAAVAAKAAAKDASGDAATALHQTLYTIMPLYKAIVSEIRRQLNVLPPSAAMAGVISMVDSTLGVAKSPANVSMGSVVKPTVNITNAIQEDLNVPLNGKAVNAIRSFPGKGVLVWGARTLDGNSQDWRYLSVRRTVIMIEQSLKIASEGYVFEPNIANTWVTVKGMMTNFLTDQWKRGALAGATPEDAFSVDIGLGVTMTPTDILDGFMNITIKLAVVRPAEFIVITFQQQMQKS